MQSDVTVARHRHVAGGVGRPHEDLRWAKRQAIDGRPALPDRVALNDAVLHHLVADGRLWIRVVGRLGPEQRYLRIVSLRGDEVRRRSGGCVSVTAGVATARTSPVTAFP